MVSSWRNTERFILLELKKLITFGALTSEHKFYYNFYDAQNSLTFKHCLRELFKTLDEKKKYVLILDNAGFHKTQCIKKFLEEYSTQISVEHIRRILQN